MLYSVPDSFVLPNWGAETASRMAASSSRGSGVQIAKLASISR